MSVAPDAVNVALVFRHVSEPPVMVVGSAGAVRSMCQAYDFAVVPPGPVTLAQNVWSPALRPV